MNITTGQAPGRTGSEHRPEHRDEGTGRQLFMNRKEIIFFDQLGFGWVVDKKIINLIHDNSPNTDTIVEKTLSDLLRRP